MIEESIEDYFEDRTPTRSTRTLNAYICRSPEKALLASIVERAIYDLKSKDQKERDSAHGWLTSPDKDRWTCYWVMEQLDMSDGFSSLKGKVLDLRQAVANREIDEATGNVIRQLTGKFNNPFMLT